MEDTDGDEVDGSDFVELEDNLKCTLCSKEYVLPKILKCRHTFCEKCIADFIVKDAKSSGAQQGFHCPTCGMLNSAPSTEEPPEKWAELLEDNYVYQGMLDIIKSSDGTLNRSTKSVVGAEQWPKRPEMTKQEEVIVHIPECIHHEKNLEFYCKGHSAILCNDCVILRHRKCNDIVKCADVLGFHINKLGDLEKSANANHEIADGLQKEIKLRLENLFRDRDRIKGEVRHMKEEIIRKLENSEMELLAQIDDTCDSRASLYEERLQCCETIMKTTAQCKLSLSTLEHSDCPEYAVNTVCERQRASESELGLLQEMMNTTLQCKLDLRKDSTTNALLSSNKHFGHVTVSNTIMNRPSVAKRMEYVRQSISSDSSEPPEKLSVERTVNALLPKEKRNNWITGICFMKDDRFVLIDRNNKRVKLYGSACEFLNFIKLRKSTLFAVTATDDDEIAVTLPIKRCIQFLSTSNNVLSTTKSLDIKQPCYGIAHALKLLFVCCSQYQNAPCCIKVFDSQENFIRDIVFDKEGATLFSSLYNAYISINPIDGLVSVVDQRSDRHTIVTFELSGEIKSIKSRDPMPNWIDKVKGVAYLDNFLFVALENRTLCTLSDVGSGRSTLCEIDTSVRLNFPCAVAVNSTKDKVAVSQVHPIFNYRDNNIVRIMTSAKMT